MVESTYRASLGDIYRVAAHIAYPSYTDVLYWVIPGTYMCLLVRQYKEITAIAIYKKDPGEEYKFETTRMLSDWFCVPTGHMDSLRELASILASFCVPTLSLIWYERMENRLFVKLEVPESNRPMILSVCVDYIQLEENETLAAIKGLQYWLDILEDIRNDSSK